MQNLTINRNQDTEFFFDVSMSGADMGVGSAVVNFLIRKNGMNNVWFMIEATQEPKTKQWSVICPKLLCDVGSSQFKVQVIFNEYVFDALKGTISIVDNATVNIKQTDTTTDKQQTKIIKNKESKSEQKSKSEQTKKEPDPESNKSIKESVIKNQQQSTFDQSNIGDTEQYKSSNTITSEQDKIITETKYPTFQFARSNHPYVSMKDGGQTDKKIKNILKNLNKSKK